MAFRITMTLFIALVLSGCGEVRVSPQSTRPQLPVALQAPVGRIPPLNLEVAKLRSEKTRDDAFRVILSWQKYRGKPTYYEKKATRVEHVVECPQPEGGSIFAVFLKSVGSKKGQPKGHVVLIDSDGTIIPFYSAANSISGVFADVNNDGIVENVESWGYIENETTHVHVDLLHVIPITRKQKPILRVAYNRDGANAKWSWTMVATGTSGVFDIVLGPKSKETGKILPKAVYTWAKSSGTHGTYKGPVGGMNLPFMRVYGANSRLLRDYSRRRNNNAARKK